MRGSWLGIDRKQARVVPDVESDIVAAVNAPRARYDYVFATGGRADARWHYGRCDRSGVQRVIDYEPPALIGSRYKAGELNEMRKRMARIPAGARLIHSVSAAPGFRT